MGNCTHIKIFGFLVGVTLLAAGPVWAGSARMVEAVGIEGAGQVSEAAIRAQLKTRPGTMTSREVLHEDIRALFAMGTFQNIRVDERRGAHGWIYTFILTEKPIVQKLSFQGNKKIKKDELKEAVTLPLYQPLDQKALVASMKAIREKYAKKKYYLAEVDYRLATTPEGDTELIFEIEEHAPTMIRHVHFVGNTVFTDEELRSVVKTRRKGAFGFITGSGKYNEEELQRDQARLMFHYLKHGYLKVNVEEPRVALTHDRRYFFVTFTVQEGPRYRIRSVALDGDILTTQAELLAELLTQEGQIYNRENIEKDMQALTRRYADQGYAFVHIRPLTRTDEIKQTADLTFQVEKGQRITIEKIEIHGNTTTRDKVIRRELQVKEGEIYSESRLQESRRRVEALGYFKEVNFATPRGSRDDTLELHITVEERPTGSFSIGLGFSTAEDFILTGSIQKQNFFGYGVSGEVGAEVSSRRQQFLLSALDPYFLDSDWILGISAFRTIFRFGSNVQGTAFDRESFGGSVSLGRRFFDYSSLTFGYEAEEVSAADLSAFVPARLRENVTGLTSLLSLTLTRDTRDNRIYANQGMFNSVKAEISGDRLGGDNDFFRINGRTQVYQPLVGQLIFKWFGRVGYIDSLNRGLVPLFERFYVGGPNSLRGFLPQSIGPREPVTSGGETVNFVFGGDKMAVFNFELEHPIYDPAGLRAVAFFDAGNAYGEAETLDLLDVRADWGFGFRWISPMGPLRFEWGFPIDRNADEQRTVFNFTIGTFF